MQHFITLVGQIALTQPGGVWGHCPVEKKIIVPLSANQMGWCIASECCGRQTGVCLSKSCPINLIYHRWTPNKLQKHLNDDQWKQYASLIVKGLNTYVHYNIK